MAEAEERCRYIHPFKIHPGGIFFFFLNTSPVHRNVYLDWCHNSRAFKEAGVGLDMAQEARSNDNLWFGACSTSYKEASDCHWLAAPLATSTRNKPPEKIFSFCEVIFFFF